MAQRPWPWMIRGKFAFGYQSYSSVMFWEVCLQGRVIWRQFMVVVRSKRVPLVEHHMVWLHVMVRHILWYDLGRSESHTCYTNFCFSDTRLCLLIRSQMTLGKAPFCVCEGWHFLTERDMIGCSARTWSHIEKDTPQGELHSMVLLEASKQGVLYP